MGLSFVLVVPLGNFLRIVRNSAAFDGEYSISVTALTKRQFFPTKQVETALEIGGGLVVEVVVQAVAVVVLVVGVKKKVL